jgi:hypothetical protein
VRPRTIQARSISIHFARKTAINDAIGNGASMHEVRQFAGHAVNEYEGVAWAFLPVSFVMVWD